MTIKDLQKEIKKNEGMTVSTGTLLNYDLLERFGEVIKKYRINDALVRDIDEIFETYSEDEINYPTGEWSDLISWLINEDIFNILNEVAPEGYYFGTLEGNGSCFGFWRVVTEDC